MALPWFSWVLCRFCSDQFSTCLGARFGESYYSATCAFRAPSTAFSADPEPVSHRHATKWRWSSKACSLGLRLIARDSTRPERWPTMCSAVLAKAASMSCAAGASSLKAVIKPACTNRLHGGGKTQRARRHARLPCRLQHDLTNPVVGPVTVHGVAGGVPSPVGTARE